MQTIHTIGTSTMEGAVAERDKQFLALLKEHHIDAVIDVRRYQHGLGWEFVSCYHLEPLVVDTLHIPYFPEKRFAPSPDILKRWKESKRTEEDWRIYERDYLALIARPYKAEDMDMLSIWKERFSGFCSPCLLCAEKSPERCHRRLLAERMSKEFRVPIVHIEGNV